MKTGTYIAQDNLFGWVEDSFGKLYKFTSEELKDNNLTVGGRVVFEALGNSLWALNVESATGSFVRYVNQYGTPT